MRSKLVMILPDLHLGSHDAAALRVVLRAHDRLKPDEVVILGDWLDCGSWSAHPKSDRRELQAATYGDEIAACRAVLERFEEHSRKITFLEGNHEYRVERWVTREKGPWLDLADKILPERCLSQGRQRKFVWVPYACDTNDRGPSHAVIAPGLVAVHGWSVSKHAAAAHLDRARGLSIVHGHTHRRQVYATRNPITGDVIEAHSMGCLSRLQPLWAHKSPTEWTQCFGLLRARSERWSLTQVPIVNGRALMPDGSLLKAGRAGSELRGVA